MSGWVTLTFWPSGKTLKAEAAVTPQERQRGLAYRVSIPDDTGMIFVMPEVIPQRFVMTGMKFRLDMIFVNEASVVVGILEDVPLPPPNGVLWGVDEPSRWVIEVNAGWCRKHGIRVGATVESGKYRG